MNNEQRQQHLNVKNAKEGELEKLERDELELLKGL
jgi:hypothetical protein